MASAFLVSLGIVLGVISSDFVQPAQGELRPESDLTSNCFDFPRQPFDPSNSIVGVHGKTPHLLLETGQDAIDFTLHDADGREWSLRAALQSGGMPVVMIWGMYTCPSYNGLMPDRQRHAYWDEFELVEEYRDRATFVHMYGPEPHPVYPGTNFDDGKCKQKPWSTVPQPTTYQERLALVAKIKDFMHPSQVLLPDYLPGNPYSDLVQPVWCSYALGARPVVMVSPEDGKVYFQLAWFSAHSVREAIDSYWAGLVAGAWNASSR